MHRRLSLFLTAFLFLLLATAAAAATDASTSRPNIVVIIADDLGYGDLSSYGAKDVQSPHIDSLVDAGMRFSNFYANCPVCSPTRASFMTGRYPDLVGVPGVIRTHPRNNWGFLAPGTVTLPDLLRKAGYTTAIVGKWHLGLTPPSTPLDRGFDFFHGFLGDMMDDYYHHRRHGNNYMRRNREVIDPTGHATDLFSQWSVEFLNSQRRSKVPFFLYLAYNAPHTPIQPPNEWIKKVLQRESGIDRSRARLVALIEHMDDGIGRVIQALKKNSQAANTLVFFTSDNGGQLRVKARCGNLRGGKQDMYEGGIKVPACAIWPGEIEAGSRTAQLAVTMDLYPTLCEVAGAKFDHEIDGRSFLDLLRTGSQAPIERDIVFVRREGGLRYNGQDYYALRRGSWKLVQNTPFEPLQLYDLAADPLETQNLAEKRRKIYKAMCADLRAHIQKAGRVPWQR